MPPPTSDNISTGEIARRLDTLLSEQRDFRVEVNTRFTSLDGTFVRREVYELAVERIAKLESNVAWVARTVGGTVIATIVGGLLAAHGLGGI